MRLTVRHATIYTHDSPLRFIAQSHRLTPAANAAQRILDWRVTCEGAVFGDLFLDGGGDRINTMTVHGPVDRLEILVEGVVDTTDTAGVLRNHAEIISPRVYLSPTAPTKMSTALGELRHKALKGAQGSELDAAHRLSAAVAEAIAWEPGTTHSHTTAAEALEEGRGVCQDHAHALIALAHASDLPARYVTGYLLTDAEEGEAAHAWAEVHIQGLGWVGFDPANRCCPDDRYIRLGSGRNALEAAPIRGVSRGGGEEAMAVSVLVTDAAQAQVQSQQ